LAPVMFALSGLQAARQTTATYPSMASHSGCSIMSLCMLALTLTLTLTLQGCGSQSPAGPVLNVLGGNLSTCSKPGMALTGFTRDGHCQDQGDDDAGSHHICIQMRPDFCTVTGQPDWCSTSKPCMGEAGSCPIGNWCVCQWAFASYLSQAGGCDSIVELVCDATNMAAYRAYSSSNDPTHKEALACIRSKCGIIQATTRSEVMYQ